MSRPPFQVLWRESHAASAVSAALLAAIPAGLVAAGVMAAGDLVAGRAADDTFARVGLVLHVGASFFFAAIFGILVAFTAHHLTPSAGAVWGALYGLLVWLVWFVLFLPFVMPDLAERMRLGLLWHLAYGATLGALFHVLRPGERLRHRQ